MKSQYVSEKSPRVPRLSTVVARARGQSLDCDTARICAVSVERLGMFLECHVLLGGS